MRTTGGRTEPIGRFAVSVPLLAAFFVLATAVPADGYRILAVETVAGKSHWNFLSAVLRSLTDAGHEVTAFTPFPDGDRENYTEVDTSGDFPMKLDMDALDTMRRYGSPVTFINAWMSLNRAYCDFVLGNERLGAAVAGNRADDREAAGFDVIVVEPLVLDCVSYLAGALDVPIVYAIPSPVYSQAERAFTGHFVNPATVSHFLSRHAVPAGTFAQRLANAALLAYSVLVTVYDERTLKTAAPRPYDSWPPVSPSVIFTNSYYVTDAPRPITANRVDVGGIHLKPPSAIPKDLLDFVEDSPHGVIYFSFGSTINMSTLPDYVESAFRKALARVPQKVLWRREEMKYKPENVMVQKWFPQRELLLHPSVKLFISHGGISGVYEAVDAGVPILGFPLFYDQPRNIGHLVHNGMAMSMDLLSVTEDILLNAIEELINNETYKENAILASRRFRDRPISPEKSVVYWTEYVVRHKGAPHLKSYALNLTWYQYFLLDVIAAVLLLTSLTVFMCYKSFKVICNYIFRFSTKNKIKVQ